MRFIKKIFQNIYLALLILVISIGLFSYAVFCLELSSVSNSDKKINVVIEPGSIDSIAEKLYKKELIKNKRAFKIYVYMVGKTNLKASTYLLSPNMGTRKIVDILYNGNGNKTDQIALTFKEGINIRAFAKIIEEYTNHTEDEVYLVLKDTTYLNELINRYWFLENAILNEDIYYSLEGYLYPDTYYFSSKDATIEEIIEKMLDEMDNKLTEFKGQIDGNSMSIHEILTLASIVELEGVSLEDRKGIAGVFLNRINDGISLGSDVTTYYGASINVGQRDLYESELNACNSYNTRCVTFKGLPVSPISNPSKEAIEAVLNPTMGGYYYFVADKNKKIYFAKTLYEHNQIIANLKKNGLWYEY